MKRFRLLFVAQSLRDLGSKGSRPLSGQSAARLQQPSKLMLGSTHMEMFLAPREYPLPECRRSELGDNGSSCTGLVGAPLSSMIVRSHACSY